MKSSSIHHLMSWLAVGVSLMSCNSPSGGGGDPTPTPVGLPNGTTLVPPTGSNVMTFTVNGSTCSAATSANYLNKPCVSVTICNPGSTTTCQTVNDVLLDTGSYGLRVFKSVIPNLNLSPVSSHQGGALTECVKFGDGSAEWGSVQMATVIMGSETPITIPIQVLDANFGSVPASCGTPDANVAAASFNGILGVGLSQNDCGDFCNGTHISNGRYFNCSDGNTGFGNSALPATCSGGSSDALTDQVQNPVSSLPVDNNGVILELPAIAATGAADVTGYVVFGIGTEANNTPPASISKLVTDADGYLQTKFNGQTYDGFLDSGSNALYFEGPTALPFCSGGEFYCPKNLSSFTAVNFDGVTQSTSNTVSFQVAGTFSSSASALNDLGAEGAGIFDFGLPFYFGRNVYLGIDGKTSTLGTGMYYAY